MTATLQSLLSAVDQAATGDDVDEFYSKVFELTAHLQRKPLAQPLPVREVKPHDHIEGIGTIRWIMGPLRAGVNALLPLGGYLVTTTADTQWGLPGDLVVRVYVAEKYPEDPCPERDHRGVGCCYRRGHDLAVFPHRFE